MYSPNIIQIRCMKCGTLHMEIEQEGKVKYDFSCKKCKYRNTGKVYQKPKENYNEINNSRKT